MTEAQMQAESHSRVERGTSCWMAGQCSLPNAYLYDAAIAAAIRQRFDERGVFADDSLWITVKRRFVWVEGCVADTRDAVALKRMMQAVPDVERVLIDVMQGINGKPPYAVLPQ
jgi:hypothetical protein